MFLKFINFPKLSKVSLTVYRSWRNRSILYVCEYVAKKQDAEINPLYSRILKLESGVSLTDCRRV